MSEATLDKWKARAAAALDNRTAMPIVTAFVDELRAAGLNPRITYACEAGREVGRRDDSVTVPATV